MNPVRPGLAGWAAGAAAVVLAASGPAAHAAAEGARVEGPDYLERLERDFAPAGPTMRMAYDLSYRLLGVTLFRLGEAQVDATTGRLGPGATEPVCLMDCRIRPPEAADPRAVLRDRFLLVTDTKERRTLLFAQMKDESYRPLIGKPKRRLQFELYDFRGSEIFHSRTNMITGYSTNQPGRMAGEARPGQEVMTLLNLLEEVHDRRREALDPASSPRIFTRVDGEMRPFAIRTAFETLPGRYPAPRTMALRADVAAAPEAKTRRGRMTVWTMTSGALAGAAGHPELAAAGASPALRVVPVALDCELPVGAVRAAIKSVGPGAPSAVVGPEGPPKTTALPAGAGGKGGARQRRAIRRPPGTPRGPPRRCRSA